MSWTTNKLGNVAEINPARPRFERDDDAMTSFVPMESVDEVLGEIRLAAAKPFERVKKGYTYFQNGDVIFAKITPCMQNGKHAVVADLIDGLGFGSTEFHVVRAGPNVQPEWIHYFLRWGNTLAEAKRTFTGAVGQQRVPPSFLEGLQIPLPPLADQQQLTSRIKQQLAEVETARAAVTEQLRDLKALTDAVYREAFQRCMPIGVPPIVHEAPNGWQWRKLTDIAQLESGHTPSRLRPDWWGGDVSWLSLTEIRALDGTWVDETQLRTNPAGIDNSAARILPRGTVCLSRTASVGFVAIMGRPMATSQDFANWVCGAELDPDFLMFALICARTSLREMATGATHKTIYMPALESFHVCAPDIDEQMRIASQLKSQLAEIDAIRSAIQHRADDIAALPQRILASAFEM